MCARPLACPLCSQPGFLNLDSLRAGLVSVATRPLACPVCNEVLLGIDKLTIHLFGHTVAAENVPVGGGNESAKLICDNWKEENHTTADIYIPINEFRELVDQNSSTQVIPIFLYSIKFHLLLKLQRTVSLFNSLCVHNNKNLRFFT